MGMKVYVGKDGVAKAVKAIYVGVKGVAKCIMRPSGIYKYNGNVTPLSAGRFGLAATTVKNYALFAGGASADKYTNTVDAYDSSLTRSTPVSLVNKCINLAATPIGNYALFAGGLSSSYDSISQVQAYDSSLTRSSPASSLSPARESLAATTLGNDYAFFAGGYDSRTSTNYSTINTYNSSLSRVDVKSGLTVARYDLAATTVGKYVVFAGGETIDKNSRQSTYRNTVNSYNEYLTQTNPTSLSYARSNLAAASVGDYALFAGGETIDIYSDDVYTNYDTVNAYDQYLTRINPLYGLTAGRFFLAATTVNDHALFAGGSSNRYDDNMNLLDTYYNTVDSYDRTLTRTAITGLDTGVDRLASTTVGKYALFAGGRYTTKANGKTSNVAKDKVCAYMYEL